MYFWCFLFFRCTSSVICIILAITFNDSVVYNNDNNVCYFIGSILVFFFTNNLIILHKFSDLSHNKIAKIPNEAFKHLSNLTTLDLSYNRIHKMMPGTVVPWRNLKTLNISGNSQLDLFSLRLTFYVSLIEFVAFFNFLFIRNIRI